MQIKVNLLKLKDLLVATKSKTHIWPYSNKPHPVGQKHNKTDKNGYKDGRSKYREGKWELIKLMD